MDPLIVFSIAGSMYDIHNKLFHILYQVIFFLFWNKVRAINKDKGQGRSENQEEEQRGYRLQQNSCVTFEET